MKDLFLIGANFRSAGASERKHLALPSEQTAKLHAAVSEQIPDAEFCILSTCNRTEFYLAGRPSADTSEALAAVIGRYCPHFTSLLDAGKIQYKQGVEAYRHLLRVSCGLESSVLGETQIMQQIRQALQTARESGSTSAYLEQAIGRALSLGSRVRSDTDISAGSPGVAAAICETIATWQPAVVASAPQVLLIGAGAINAAVARLLAHNTSYQLVIINRTEARAQSLAQEFSLRARPWSELPRAVAQAAVVVTATSSVEPVVTAVMLKRQANTVNSLRRKLVIDAGMPPNVEACSENSVDIVGIDGLAQLRDQQLNRRRAAIAEVESRIEQEVADWKRWLAQRPLESVLKSLYLDLSALPEQLSQHLNGRQAAASDNFEYVIHRHLKQLLHPHVMDLRRMVRAKASHSELSV